MSRFRLWIVILAIASGLFVFPAYAYHQAYPSMEQDMLTRLNNYRVANGVNPLISDDQLINEARSRSSDMAKRGYFHHYAPPDGHTIVEVLLNKGINFFRVGENIAWNTTLFDFQVVGNTWDDFVNSPSHNANMLDSRWTHVGIGIVSNHYGDWFITQVFIQR